MIKIEQVDKVTYEIVGDSIVEIIEECLKRVRQSSRSFYEAELRNDLKDNGVSWIDKHAGMGYYYNVFTEEKRRDIALSELTKQSQKLNLDY